MLGPPSMGRRRPGAGGASMARSTSGSGAPQPVKSANAFEYGGPAAGQAPYGRTSDFLLMRFHAPRA